MVVLYEHLMQCQWRIAHLVPGDWREMSVTGWLTIVGRYRSRSILSQFHKLSCLSKGASQSGAGAQIQMPPGFAHRGMILIILKFLIARGGL